MHFQYCPQCGSRLTGRVLGDEGEVPWCDACGRPLFDMFSTCIICAVMDDEREVALIQQNGITGRYICVAGFMKPGESAEDCVRREVEEEIGQMCDGLQYVGSWPHKEGEQLMLGFAVRVHRQAFTLSGEVDRAAWLPFDEALQNIREGSIAWHVVQRAMAIYDTMDKE